MIKIVIFDDHQHRREALKLLIALEKEMQCVGDYENCEDVIEHLSTNPPDVVLMDIDMPKVNGIDGVKLIKKNFPGICIIMQTVFEDDEKIFNSILGGANGYILKKTPPEKLIEAIYDVVNAGAPMTATVARRVLELFQKQKHPEASCRDNANAANGLLSDTWEHVDATQPSPTAQPSPIPQPGQILSRSNH